MDGNQLVELIHSGSVAEWADRNQAAFDSLFGSSGGRYPVRAKEFVALRAPEMRGDSGVAFAAYIHPANPRSGQYSGLSFAIFPVENKPSLVTLVVGTQGLGSDTGILGRPGHARKTQAIAEWLNKAHGQGQLVAWAKHDPTRTDISIPEDIRRDWQEYKSVFDRYGEVIYAAYRPNSDATATRDAVAAFLDLLFAERGFEPISQAQADALRIRAAYFAHLTPTLDADAVAAVLERRRFVILQGPPGTGKTRLAQRLLGLQYSGRGRTVQFHPGTTYEQFIGGLAPVESAGELGLRFRPLPGILMQAAAEALADPRPYLLHIDEINRADLGKVLGEAIFLFEPNSDQPRTVGLPFNFGQPFGQNLHLPPNLHVIGTMNSADRSIAILDVAVRRRFGFLSLWPSMQVVQEHGGTLMQDAFLKLFSLFTEHASEEAFAMVPGHSYFLENDDDLAPDVLRLNLLPLLEEYLSQGYVAGFAEQIRAYIQWLRAL